MLWWILLWERDFILLLICLFFFLFLQAPTCDLKNKQPGGNLFFFLFCLLWRGGHGRGVSAYPGPNLNLLPIIKIICATKQKKKTPGWK